MPGAVVRGLLVVLAVAVMAGCTVHYVTRAERAYAEGRYLEVVEDLSSHEADVPQLPVAKRARFGLVLGLALLELGDRQGARQWLDDAEQLEALQPTLTPAQRQQLAAGRKALAGEGKGTTSD